MTAKPAKHFTDWQKRLLKERHELGERLVKLTIFMSDGDDATVPTYERGLLRKQRDLMVQYLDVLNDRCAVIGE